MGKDDKNSQWGRWMRLLLSFSALIDAINEKIGYVCNWLVLLSCIVSAGNAMIRYAYDTSSNAWLESSGTCSRSSSCSAPPIR